MAKSNEISDGAPLMNEGKNRPDGKRKRRVETSYHRVVLLVLIFLLTVAVSFPDREAASGVHPVEESQLTLESILRVAPTGVGLVKNRVILHVNDYILNMTGYSRKELLGKSARIFYPTREEYEWVGKEKYAQIAARGTGSVETRWRRKDGAIRHVILSSTPIIPGRVDEGVTFTVLDITDRKVAENRLQESEERFKSLFHNHAVVMLLIDPQTGAIEDANYAATAFYGWPREELLEMNINQINTLSPEEIMRVMQRARTHDRTHFEFSHRRADGSIRDVAVFSSGVAVEGRTLLFSVIHDITAQKQTEAALASRTRWFMTGLTVFVGLLLLLVIWLITGRRQRRLVTLALRQSEKKHGDLFEKAPVGIFESTPEGRYLTVNPAYAKIVGYDSPEDMMADLESAVDIYARPEDRERLKDELSRRGYVRDYEIEFRRRDGGHIWVATNTAAINEPAGGTIYTGYVIDITERKQAEQEIKESEERYRLLFEAANDAIILLEMDGRIIDCNEKAVRVFRSSERNLVGKRIIDLSPECQPGGINSRDAVQKINTAVKEKTQLFEWRFIRLDGTSFDTEVFLVRIYRGKLSLLQAVVRDLSERKQVEAEKEKLHIQLIQAQKMESVGRLAGGVAHDFNNMLGVILGYAELAMMRLEPGDKVYDYLNEIQKAARRSADFTRQLLAFARRQTVLPKELRLNETVAGMLKMIERIIGEDIDLDWNPGEELWPVKMDPSQVDQIMANLCVNARDAIDGVGKVTIETGNVTFDKEYCAHNAGVIPGDYVLLAVSDNGCGMDVETLSHIFEPFFTTKERGKGTGLGLATVYGIVKQNEGFINVYSEPGRGTTFKIYLPRYLAVAAHPPAKELAPEAASGRETVLLVEDEPMLLTMTKAMLEMQGYVVLAANSPGVALRMAEEHSGRIDLLLTDVVMPGMNGRDLAAKMAAVCPDLKLLFMSGYTANVIAHHGVLEEGVHFIQKPFSQAALAAKVREALKP